MKYMLCSLLVTLLLLCTGCTNSANLPNEARSDSSVETEPGRTEPPKEAQASAKLAKSKAKKLASAKPPKSKPNNYPPPLGCEGSTP